MCHHAGFDVPAEPQSVPSARDFCRQTLTGWGLAQMVDDTLLILSELVTNGLMHAVPPVAVTVSSETGNVEIAVSDGSATLPTVRPRRNDLNGDLDAANAAEGTRTIADDRDPRLDVGAAGSVVGGRGMQLVAFLAAEWGVDLSGPGKSVWARLPVPSGWAPAASCPCAATGSVRLSSGRHATDR